MTQDFTIPNFYQGGFDDFSEFLVGFVGAHRPACHVSLNASALYWASRNENFKKALTRADLVTADGASIVMARRLLGFPTRSQLPGVDLMDLALRLAGPQGWGVTLVGARSRVLEILKKRCQDLYSNLSCSIELWRQGQGFVSDLAGRMRSRGDRLLFVSLPRPSQDIWLDQNKEILGLPFMMGVGGSFEVLAGEANRAPRLWRRFALEWLFRFLQEPRRRLAATLQATFWFGGYLAKLWLAQKKLSIFRL